MQFEAMQPAPPSDARSLHAGFQPENWKTKSMKLGKGMGNAAVSGAVGAKNMTVSGAKRCAQFQQQSDLGRGYLDVLWV
jgi:hypothetical protein